jgi:hypothetical protein
MIFSSGVGAAAAPRLSRLDFYLVLTAKVMRKE